MSNLGAILAGGRSTRFGGDKAAAIVAGRALLDHVADGLRPQVDALVICGRAWGLIHRLDDRPGPDLGPLGGLCAALKHAAAAGHDAVLTVGCDVLPVPVDLLTRLGEGPACIEGQPLFGLWPSSLSALLDAHLAQSQDRSMRGWIARCGARRVALDLPLHNINTRRDLALCAASLA